MYCVWTVGNLSSINREIEISIGPFTCYSSQKSLEIQWMFKKVRSARLQALWRAERTGVREHDKGPRTPLTPFFNIPSHEYFPVDIGDNFTHI